MVLVVRLGGRGWSGGGGETVESSVWAVDGVLVFSGSEREVEGEILILEMPLESLGRESPASGQVPSVMTVWVGDE